MYLLHAITAEDVSVPAVYEDVDDTPNLEASIRVARHPTKQSNDFNKPFIFQNAHQQDPQKLRYARQQQVDNYMRSYYQRHRQSTESSRTSKARKLEIQREKGEPFVPSIQIDYPLPIAAQQVQLQQDQRKVAPVKSNQRSNLQRPETTRTTSRPDKAERKSLLSYQVSENYDQEVQPSQKRVGTVYVGQEELLKSLQYPYLSNAHALPPQYTVETKTYTPTYTLPALSHSNAETLPALSHSNALSAATLSHNAATYGTVKKSELEALNSLIGKPATLQLQGLHQLLGQGQHYAYAYPVQEEAKKEYTPITEQVVDIANTQSKPNIVVQPTQFDTKPRKYIEQLKSSQEIKSPLDHVSINSANPTNTTRNKRETMERIREHDNYSVKETFDYVEYDENDYDYHENTTLLPEIPETLPPNMENQMVDRVFNLDKKIYAVQKVFGLVPEKKMLRRPPKRRAPLKPRRKPFKPHLHPPKSMQYPEKPPILGDYPDYYADYHPGSGYEDHQTTSEIYIIPEDAEVMSSEAKNVIVINNSNDNHNHGSNVEVTNGKPSHGHKIRTHRPPQHHHGKRRPRKSRVIMLDRKIDIVLAKLKKKDILE